MPPRPTCECGTCRTCYMRRAKQKYYRKRAEETKKRTAAQKRARARDRSPEVSDEEMDRRALILMGRLHV